MLGRRQKELESRKKLILDRSRKLFFQRGFESVTIEDICRAVEFGRSAIYAQFQSKEDIYAHIKLEGLNRLANRLERAVDARGAAEDGLRGSGQALLKFFEQEREYYRALFYARPPQTPELLSAAVVEATELAAARARTPLLQLLERGPAKFRSIDPAETVELFWAGLTGVINASINHGQENQRPAIRRRCGLFVEIYINGMGRL